MQRRLWRPVTCCRDRLPLRFIRCLMPISLWEEKYANQHGTLRGNYYFINLFHHSSNMIAATSSIDRLTLHCTIYVSGGIRIITLSASGAITCCSSRFSCGPGGKMIFSLSAWQVMSDVIFEGCDVGLVNMHARSRLTNVIYLRIRWMHAAICRDLWNSCLCTNIVEVECKQVVSKE